MSHRPHLLSGLSGIAIIACAVSTPAYAQQAYNFDIPAQDLGGALRAFAKKSGFQVVFDGDALRGKRSAGYRQRSDAETALRTLLRGTGLSFSRDGNLFVVAAGGNASAAPASAEPQGEPEIVVTAQKRVENIQVVPISVTALSQEDLTTRQVATGADLMTQVPNMTFTKTNFTGYSIQIRGIGTQAVSATTDAAVAIAFNNTSFIRNRFFEQEFYDLERIEVLRGPQGTLYGRNATAGVVNLISAKPKFRGDAKLSVDIGNFGGRRIEGMINAPLVEDKVAVRLAGAWTKRDGYTTNLLDGRDIDGRNLWSTRLSVLVEPTDTLRANFVWEHFSEDDDRMRSAKQLCKKDPGPSEVGGLPIVGNDYGAFDPRSFFNQGCLPTSLYGDDAFQTPNGYSLPFYGPTGNVLNNVRFGFDPYASTTQSRNLREIESALRPEYRAKTDTLQLQLGFDITPDLTLTSETAYMHDDLRSFQDYNRFNTKPGVFVENSLGTRPGILDENGVFCDPQLGCSDTLLLGDYSTGKSKQYSQEVRVSSDFDGPFNFSLGANFLRYKTEDRYYVFINSLTMLAATAGAYQNDIPYVSGVTDNAICQPRPGRSGDPYGLYGIFPCTYIDPNPVGRLNGQGRNYFLSRNPYKLTSYAAFGEAYYDITDNLKITGGFRWTVDKKHAPQIPSWLLASNVIGEYAVSDNVDQKWSEPTGRLAIDWRPTEDNLLYASFSHGYKAGGANPPPPVIATYQPIDATALGDNLRTHKKTFDAEYINAFEIGSKNTLFDGRVTLNLAAFYYDYKGYQISQIIDRAAVNQNFDAEVWGAEIEADWRPADNLRLSFKGGYQGTKLAKGSGAVDTMDRTAGDPNYVVVKPFPTMTSNCIIPIYALTAGGELLGARTYMGSCYEAYYRGLDIATGLPYVPNPTVRDDPSAPGTSIPLGSNYAGYIGFDPRSVPNGGAGITKDLSGNELPNAPHFTGTFSADYTIDMAPNWSTTLHADLYFQSRAWTRVFNTPGYDRLKSYSNVNLAVVVNNEAAGLQVMAYVKNVFDKTSLTGAFLNSDDSGLTTNVFLTEPRLFGLRVTKNWNGSSILGGLFTGRKHVPGTPYPFQVEVGAGLGRFTSRNEIFVPRMAGEYQPSLQFPLGMQKDDLGRDNEREIKLTYATLDGWRISGAVRSGSTNASSRSEVIEKTPGGIKSFPHLPGLEDTYIEGLDNYATSELERGEKHRIIDFMVGKDVGIGVFGERSTVSAGLRYARFKSRASLAMFGSPDNYIPEFQDSKYQEGSFSIHSASLARTGQFKGVGPTLSWDASKRLAGDDASGHLDLDWNLSGGLLFGTQRTAGSGKQKGLYSYLTEEAPRTRVNGEVRYNETFNFIRSQRVTVPTFGANLGVSYTVDRLKVGAGYRWEGYLRAIDGGIDQSKRYDRNMEGPYVKVTLGFGG